MFFLTLSVVLVAYMKLKIKDYERSYRKSCRIDQRVGVNTECFCKEVGLGSSNLSRKLKGSTPFTAKDFVKICDSIGVNREWLETGEGEKRTYSVGYDKNAINMAIDKAFTQCVHGEDAKPFYDVDFALGFSEMYNDSPNTPTKYISVPGYEKTDFWCRTSGDSMKPLISNGDIIALKQILDWSEFLPMNEVYAIMTTNDLRTVKIIRKGSDNEHFTLHAINEEYEDQEIKKSAITKVFKVLGSLKAL